MTQRGTTGILDEVSRKVDREVTAKMQAQKVNKKVFLTHLLTMF